MENEENTVLVSEELSAWLSDVSIADDLRKFRREDLTKDTQALYVWNGPIWSIRVFPGT